MRLAAVIDLFEESLLERYGDQLLPGARKALSAMKRCRSEDSQHCLAGCTTCETCLALPHSCGHRSCPHCQNGVAEQWIQRQRERKLPVDYFMATFTLPAQLRPLAWAHQRIVFDAMMQASWQTLKTFALNDPMLAVDIGATAVLHTHSRTRDFHPHVHMAVPAGGLTPNRQLWRRKDRYLFNGKNLATVFRGKLLQALVAAGLTLPASIPAEWVVDCSNVGTGDQALVYLGRYLYRGVLSERDIIDCVDGRVRFRYIESKTKAVRHRTLDGADFLWLLLQHVLPRGFRRVRDYGLLHPAKLPLIKRIQCLLQVTVATRPPPQKTPLRCPTCGAPMRILATRLSPIKALTRARLGQAARSIVV